MASSRGVGVLLSLIAVLVVVSSVTADDTCNAHTDCSGCLQQEGCGWCGFPQQCKAGNASGDSQGTCYLSWTYGKACPDCGSFKDCSSCLENNYLCGWCGPTQSCIVPTYDPKTNMLIAPTCHGDFSNGMETLCPDCGRGKSCRDCSELDDGAGRCGWCNSEFKCMEGDSQGPYTKDSCKPWNYLSCTYCQLHESCYDCTHDPECGWCPSSPDVKCLIQGTNHTLDCNGSWAIETDECENPYPWEPHGERVPSTDFEFDVVDGIGVAVGGLFLFGLVGIIVYLGVRKYVRAQQKNSYAAIPAYSVSS